MSSIDSFKRKAVNAGIRIVFPEGSEDRIIEALRIASKKNVVKPILLGREEEIKPKLKGVKAEIIDPSKSVKLKEYAKEYSRITGIGLSTCEKIVLDPLYYGALALRKGDCEALIAGAEYSSGDVIAVSTQIVGLSKGVGVPSSFFLIEVPGKKPVELLFADSSVNICPCPSALADIAVTTARTAETLFGWIPRVAMLSFSTKGSADHPMVASVVEATRLAKKKAPKYFIDGEMQGDTALVEGTARKKIKGELGKVAGRANVLVFPDLNSGNISYKLVQALAGANAYGPILQGFRKPVSDLSRGAKAEDIFGVMCLMASWVKKR